MISPTLTAFAMAAMWVTTTAFFVSVPEWREFTRRTCPIQECEAGYVCVEVRHQQPECMKGCLSPSGKFLEPGSRGNREKGISCDCYEEGNLDTVLVCKCELPNGELIFPGETGSGRCESCTCDESLAVFCDSVACFLDVPPCVFRPFDECNVCLTPSLAVLYPDEEILEGNKVCTCDRTDITTRNTKAECYPLGCMLFPDEILMPGSDFTDQCKVCTCDEATETLFCVFYQDVCFAQLCDNPVVPDGECCPRCDGCLTPFGRYLTRDQEVTEGDELCTCVRTNDDTGIIEATCRRRGCVVPNNGFILPGETYSDPCGSCICNGASGTLSCLLIECSTQLCDNPVVPDGECCPICDVCVTPSGKHIARDQEVTEGDEVCTCIRTNDDTEIVEATCRRRGCVVPNNGFILPGEIYSEPCGTCICDERTATLACLIIQCVPPECDDAVVLDGECCPSCEDSMLEKPGFCPIFLDRAFSEECPFECDYDSDCEGDLKCCEKDDCYICNGPVF